MAFIEGIGDEVVLVVIGFLVLLLILAWFSTHVHERPRIDFVILDERHISRVIRVIRDVTTTQIGYIIWPNSQRQTNNVQADADADEQASEATNSNEQPSENNTSSHDEIEAQENSAVVSNSSTNEAEAVNETVTEQVAATETDNNDDTPQETISSNSTINNPPQLSNPTSGEGLRQRRLAFFSGNKINTDSSQVSVNEPTTRVPECEVQQESTPQQPSVQDEGETGESHAHDESAEAGDDANRLEGHIRIRIKFLNDQQRAVQSRPESTITQFKSVHFAGELAENMSVRLIYNGQELQTSRTLQSYNIIDLSVIHCLLSRAATASPSAPTASSAIENFDVGTLVFPLFGIILGLTWYCRIVYRSYFNAMSTFSLFGITFLFVIAALASFHTRGGHEQAT